MLLLENPIRAYAWGAPDGLAALVGTPPTGGPEAELWVGTHPGAPSVVAAGEHAGRTLAEVIADDPAAWLGEELAAKGLTALPFLLKVLAIGAPLSPPKPTRPPSRRVPGSRQRKPLRSRSMRRGGTTRTPAPSPRHWSP